LSELSASLAHEINQPLGVILSNAEAAEMLLQKDSPDVAQIREIVADIITADRRAADVITRLRSLLHQDEPDVECVKINDVIEDALRHLREDTDNQNVSVKVILARGIPGVQADRTLLVQAILNLLTNACDAVAGNLPGNRSITIKSAFDGKTIDTTVIDNGSGLPRDPAQLFDPFFTTKSSGLGMGLAIAQSVAIAHDGRIWAELDSAGNTNFHFYLPVAQKSK
jgi:C4-dicarboxylate-specific signal transduction histidine kinase